MIRLAQSSEAAVVREVVLAAYQRYVAAIGKPPGPMLDDYADRIARQQAWVLDASGQIAGVLVLEPQPDGMLLDNVAVRPQCQGSGYGRQLLDFAEAEAGRRGCSSITLYTHVLMRENIAIYAARGYVERERRHENGFDRVYMVKLLG